MKHFALLLTAIFASTFLQAQITGPDTLCVGTPATFSAPGDATTYTWMPDTANLSAALTPVSTAVGTTAAVSIPIVATMNKDGANYYSFVTTYNSNQVWRYSYGTSPMNAPTTTLLGTFGLTSGQTEDIFVVFDGTNWFGFVVSGPDLLRLNFGTSLSNTPTSTLMSYPANLSWPHQLVIKKWNGSWYGFVANRNGQMTRLDFGAALTTAPTATNLPNVGSVSNPCNFVLHEEGGQWYALISSLISGNLTRYSFGTNLANNAPTGVNLGTFGVFTIPRGVILFDDCNQLTGVVVNENTQMYKLDFANTVLNTPTVTSLGTISGATVVNSTTSFTHNDTVYLMCPGSTAVRRIPHLVLPTTTEHVYYNNAVSLSFPTPGTYNLSVATDQGYGTGAKAFCKQVVVTPNCSNTIINAYAAVLGYDTCTNTFAVDDATGFAAGDSVLMIQMKGAVIDSSNTSSFGNILNIANAGNYEYNAVQSVTGNNIRLVNAMQRSYTIPAGRVQFVRVPHFASYTVNTRHTAMPWNGSKGGVFAISVSGALTVDSAIDVTGTGFRGGVQVAVPPSVQNCGITTWSGPVSINLTAQKGEGIAEVSSAKMGGRGKLANGGGAGNAHNAGGGGGANGGAGGVGGSEFNGCNTNPNSSVTQGIGGLAMTYANLVNKVFLGGGGGAGEVNNYTQSSGGAGGGIIAIRAGSIVAPSNGQLVAAGQGAPECVASGPNNICHDGMGGGGAGGSIMLATTNVTGSLVARTAGGKGANMSAAASYGQVGPGGGGGGGVLWYSGATIPANVTAQTGPGSNGLINYNSQPWGAAPGLTGLSLTGLTLPIANVPFVTPCLNDTIINAYAAVLAYDSCTNAFTVDTAQPFNVGDTVLIIQMKGAAIDSSNTSAFGTMVQAGNSGNYEFNVIQSKIGNVLRLQNVLLRSYTVPAGKVQLVRVPHFSSYTVTQPHTAPAWNGAKGGVVVMSVANNLALTSHINVSGKGFRPGVVTPAFHNQYIINQTDYFFPQNAFNGAPKGEGAAEVSTSKIFCRGPLLQGGGGANSTNSGGGGGGNAGVGGRGGKEWINPSGVALSNGGLGGRAFTYTAAQNRLYLGGGGGAGHANDGVAPNGGRGGGLVIIRAASITSNGGSIRANGLDAPDCINCIDGAGGAGAAGAIVLNAASATNLSVSAVGGEGASITNSGNDPYGPGGGGGGGALLVNNSALLTNISSTLSGGLNGTTVSASGAIANDALPGAVGVSVAGVAIPVANVPFVSAPPVTIQDSILNCRTVLFTATGGGAGTPTWNFGNGVTGTGNPVTYTYPAGGTYVASIQFPGCSGSDTETVVLPSNPTLTITGNPSVCAGASTPLTASGASTYTWSPATGLNTTSGSTVTASPTATTTYTVTGTASTGCTGTALHALTVNPIPSVTANSIPSTICQGAVSTLSAATTIPATFSWSPGGASQGITQVSPTTTTIYTVTASAAGCTATDTALVTVLPKPVVTISTPDATVCPQTAAVLTASAGSTTGTYTWASPLSGNTTSITTPLLSGPATFAVYFLASNGCRDTATQAIGIHTLPTVVIAGPTLLCSNAGSATLTASGASTYSWTPATYLSSPTGGSVQAAPPVGTSITYTVTGTDANGCANTAQHGLLVEASPVVSAGLDTSYCSGGSVILKASGASSYTWSPSNSSAAGDCGIL